MDTAPGTRSVRPARAAGVRLDGRAPRARPRSRKRRKRSSRYRRSRAGRGAGHDDYKFLPTITSLTPNAGSTAGGTSVTVTGSGFALGPGTVFKFATIAGTAVNCTSSTECTVTSPAQTAGTVDVK